MIKRSGDSLNIKMEVDWNGHLQTNLTLTNLKQPKYAIKTHEEYKRSKEGVKHKSVVKSPQSGHFCCWQLPLLFWGQNKSWPFINLVSVWSECVGWIIKSNSMKKENIGQQPWQDQVFLAMENLDLLTFNYYYILGGE